MKRFVERDGKFYARVTFIDSAGKERQIWRRAENKSHAKELGNEPEAIQLESVTSVKFADTGHWLIEQRPAETKAALKKF